MKFNEKISWITVVNNLLKFSFKSSGKFSKLLILPKIFKKKKFLVLLPIFCQNSISANQISSIFLSKSKNCWIFLNIFSQKTFKCFLFWFLTGKMFSFFAAKYLKVSKFKSNILLMSKFVSFKFWYSARNFLNDKLKFTTAENVSEIDGKKNVFQIFFGKKCQDFLQCQFRILFKSDYVKIQKNSEGINFSFVF